MALVPDQKFSTFQVGGSLVNGDIIVGLRGGINTQFTWANPAAVDSITGTADQVLVNGTSGSPVIGNITLTLPQDIGTSNSPTFAGLTLTNPLTGANGGTGINNGSLTINLGSASTGYILTSDSSGNATWQPASASGSVTTLDGDSGSATPLSGVITISGASTGLIFTGASHTLSLGGVLGSTYGGTGVNNGASTLTLGGSLTTTGAFTSNFTMTGATNVTFPTSGTLATVGGTVSSAQGTANQILVNATSGTPQTGAITLTLPSTLIAPGTIAVGNMLLDTNTLSVTNSNGNLNLLANGSGLVLLNNNTAVSISGVTPTVEINNTTGGGMLISRFVNSAASPGTLYLKSRGATINSHAAVQNGDILAVIEYFADDGTTFNTIASQVDVTVSGSVSTGIVPAQYRISTMDTSGVLRTAMFLTNDQHMGLGNPLQLNYGGTNANLIASNGGIVYSTASAMAILNGTATAKLPLLSGSSAAPSWGAFALSLGGALTTAGALTLSGAFASTFTFTNTTSVTFPTSGTLATTSQIPTGAALTKTDDTNVTLTLGGSPSTALVNAASLTLGWTGQLGLTRGGTNASLVASNGGIIYSTASAMAVLAGTSTANQVLLSGSSTTPAWSTATYPATTTINQILYSSAANTIAGLATANSSVLVTNGSGVPSLSTTLPSGLAATNMTLTTPTLGVASATSINFGGGALSSYVPKTSFTPTFTFATPGDLSVSYASQVGLYERNGNVVTYQIILTCTPTFTTASGSIEIGGLPITVLAGGYQFVNNIINDGGLTYSGSTIYATPNSGQTFLTITNTKSATGATTLTTTALVSGVAITFKIWGSYFV